MANVLYDMHVNLWTPKVLTNIGENMNSSGYKAKSRRAEKKWPIENITCVYILVNYSVYPGLTTRVTNVKSGVKVMCSGRVSKF